MINTYTHSLRKRRYPQVEEPYHTECKAASLACPKARIIILQGPVGYHHVTKIKRAAAVCQKSSTTIWAEIMTTHEYVFDLLSRASNSALPDFRRGITCWSMVLKIA
jgi:hypothetical protein